MSSKYRLRLLLAYEGTQFSGWQVQAQGEKTIQGELEKALSRIFTEPIHIVGAGRTDAGVHAFGQQAHCDLPRDPKQYELKESLQQMTSPAIFIRKLWLAPREFHALHSAEKKTYRYTIYNHPHPHPFRYRHMTWIRQKLDLDHLHATTRYLLGEKDFKSFQNMGTEVQSTIREIYKAEWKEVKPGVLTLTLSGNGFLKQMIRNIVGTQIDLAIKGKSPEIMEKIIEAQDRQQAMATAPPEGLYLARVFYPKKLDNECRQI